MLIWDNKLHCIFASDTDPNRMKRACYFVNKVFSQNGIDASAQVFGAEHCLAKFRKRNLHKDYVTFMAIVTNEVNCCYAVAYDTSEEKTLQRECSEYLSKILCSRVKNVYKTLIFPAIPRDRLVLSPIYELLRQNKVCEDTVNKFAIDFATQLEIHMHKTVW